LPVRRSGSVLLHGARAALALSRTSAPEARKLHKPADAPYLKFVDLGGHGYGLVTVTADWLDTEFVYIPVPFGRRDSADGGPLRYRVRHRVNRWKAEHPKLAQIVVESICTRHGMCATLELSAEQTTSEQRLCAVKKKYRNRE
jgi:hypothetical protein